MSITSLRDLKYVFENVSNLPDERLSPELLLIRHNELTDIQKLINSCISTQMVYEYAFFAMLLTSHVDTFILLFDQLKTLSFDETIIEFDNFSHLFEYRFTLVGLSIHKRRVDILKYLISQACKIDNIYKKTKYSLESNNAIALYLNEMHYVHGDKFMLEEILSHNPKTKIISNNDVFNLAIHTSYEEFVMIMEYKDENNECVNINSLFREENDRSGKFDKMYIFYSSEVNLFDLVVMNAQMKNLLDYDDNAIQKVVYLINRGINIKAKNNVLDKTFLHIITINNLIELPALKDIDINHRAVLCRYNKNKYSAINIAYDHGIITKLIEYGAIEDDASYIKFTKTYHTNLERINYDTNNQKENYLINCVKSHDIPAFISLIASGYSLETTTKSSGWTALHNIFSQADGGHVSDSYDFIDIASDNIYLHFANILIKHHVKPLKDTVGRTPLMCMSFHAHNLIYINKIIDLYINYEADYYELNRDEYKCKFFKLREGAFKSVETVYGLGPSVSVPIKSVFDNFWESFETRNKFDPKRSHDPVTMWNNLF